MNYLSVENISRRFGERVIFKDISFGMAKGDKLALVAQNGTGKSTLLNILAQLDEPDDGQVVYRKGIKVRYLSQDPDLPVHLKVWDAVFEGSDPVMRAVKKYEECIENQVEGEELQNAIDQIEELKAWDTEVRVKTILTELDIHHYDLEVGQLSGGQKKRLALARLLLENPDFLILDEPTNHLDLDMIEWLERFLINENLTLLMVTHDRYFLERVCNVILEMDDHGLYSYKGNYSYFLEKREERKQIEASEITKAKNLYRKELDWMRRQPKARGTKAKARVDSFYDLKQVAKRKIDQCEVELEINMQRLGSKILEFHTVGKSFGEKHLFEKFSYKFVRGEKAGIIGKNGTGKSTLLNMVMGLTEPTSGKIVVGDTVSMGYYNQEGMNLKPDGRVIEIVREVGEYLPLNKGKKLSAAQLLERFLFPRSMHFNRVEKLSGGEKKRLHLLTILMKNPNFLILDEPTNDLDIMTLNVLENFLLDFPGCVLIVSHDRYFMDKLVDHLFVFNQGTEIRDFPGNYSLWRNEKKPPKEAKAVKPESEKSEKKKSDRSNKLTFNEKREFGLLEKDIERLEKRKAQIDQKFLQADTSPEELMELSEELGIVLQQLDEKGDRWLELSEKVE
ncbi:ABC-F family ATP-binding cassette domain-containing protein [bacterium SCSIO 12741]|nr:ABC-F family ATP-binding cassette domain-containing protein [bacterium SCSIO 12741]